jgi:ferric-dicitrate binding protein FerR (iron transport regulator)
MNELERLFDSYSEGDLSASDEARLCAWLRDRPEHVDMFVRETFLHSELFSIARRQFLHEGVLRSSRVESGSSHLQENGALDVPYSIRQSSRHGRRYWMAGLAAGLAAVAAWGVWTATRPAMVGQLTQAAPGAVWQHRSEVLKAGEFLYEGQELQLARGRALMTLGSGARVVVEGPAQLSIVDDNRIWLATGRVGATVPTQAIGFTVETASGDFVDLGTEFTLDRQGDGKCRLLVFTGMVEVRPKTPKRVSRPFQIPQTQGVVYDPATDVAEPMPVGNEVRLGL